MPNDVPMGRYKTEAEDKCTPKRLWRGDIPPFLALRGRTRRGDRLVCTPDLAGREVTVHLTVTGLNGGSHPRFTVRFGRGTLARTPAVR